MNEGLGELRVSKTLFYNGRMVVEENGYDLLRGNPGQNLAGRQKM